MSFSGQLHMRPGSLASGVSLEAFPGRTITHARDLKRQQIVDSWPEDVDDGLARRDWGFAPRFHLRRAFADYLVPTIRRKYESPR